MLVPKTTKHFANTLEFDAFLHILQRLCFPSPLQTKAVKKDYFASGCLKIRFEEALPCCCLDCIHRFHPLSDVMIDDDATT